MDVVHHFVIALTALTLAAIALAPPLLSWPQRVRWTVATQAIADAGCAVGAFLPLDLREVVLASVDTRGGTLTVGVLEVGRPAAATLTFAGLTPADADVVSMLREWRALRTPTLLYIDRAGIASLDGPAAGITDLRRVRPLTPAADPCSN